MKEIRTVVCTLTLTGTPGWVAETLKNSWVVPDRGQTARGIFKIGAEAVSDETRTVSDENFDLILGRRV